MQTRSYPAFLAAPPPVCTRRNFATPRLGSPSISSGDRFERANRIAIIDHSARDLTRLQPASAQTGETGSETAVTAEIVRWLQTQVEKKDEIIKTLNDEKVKMLQEKSETDRAHQDAQAVMAINAAKYFISSAHVDSRGILEFAHNWTCDARFFSEDNVRRVDVWKYLLTANKEFRNSIKDKCGFSPQQTPKALSDIYQKLSGRVHGKMNPEHTKSYPVQLVLDSSRNGILLPEETYALTCVARAFGISFDLFDSSDIDRKKPLEVYQGISLEAERIVRDKFADKTARNGRRAQGRLASPTLRTTRKAKQG